MRPARYSESLLQWVWENLQFDCSGLKLQNGESLGIEDPGEINHGSGPDFKGAVLRVGQLKHHGSVEIHLNEEEWFAHGHHLDENFNSVILHVVLHAGKRTAEMQAGHKVPTLILSDFLDKPLFELLKIKEAGALPCSGQVKFISQVAFERQVEKAHREYFDFKVDELLDRYPAEAVPSEAWRHSFIQNVYRTLGIPSNREQMENLFLEIQSEVATVGRPEEFEKSVLDGAFSERKANSSAWINAGMRPGSRPARRVRQAAALHYGFSQISLKTFLMDGVNVWDRVMRDVSKGKRPGRQRENILFYTVYLPAIYLLGDLFHSEKLKRESYQAWRQGLFHLPGEVVRPFKRAGFQVNRKVKKAGLAHQFKRYCLERNCHQCEVFKSAINP
ncbi:DUF2851 family protein [Rhodohalobacter halophilus]|uniref:DUF2851 family protein n=1 Tax=Rhodohalobacter halophilus TaxID=1812810 RepID=UPI00083FA7C7|nr:DUF2851 family protein [Rhodohalobacter halophilus]